MPASSADAAVAAVTLSSVDVRYDVAGGAESGVEALVGLDLEVPQGQRVALLGSSGAGKSTLLDVIAGVVRRSSGSVEVLGTPLDSVEGRRLREHRSRVGVVRQEHGLPASLRVVHNVNGGRLGRWSTVRSLLSLLVPQGRDDVDAVLAHVGLDGYATRRTGDLSGGQQQRVAVARVLLQQPDLILADEPVSAVDPKLSVDVVELLCGHDTATGRTRTTILSLHDPELASGHVDRIVGIAAGRIVLDAPADAVDASMIDAVYRAHV